VFECSPDPLVYQALVVTNEKKGMFRMPCAVPLLSLLGSLNPIAAPIIDSNRSP
jgi:hypothetical protein